MLTKGVQEKEKKKAAFPKKLGEGPFGEFKPSKNSGGKLFRGGGGKFSSLRGKVLGIFRGVFQKRPFDFKIETRLDKYREGRGGRIFPNSQKGHLQPRGQFKAKFFFFFDHLNWKKIFLGRLDFFYRFLKGWFEKKKTLYC